MCCIRLQCLKGIFYIILILFWVSNKWMYLCQSAQLIQQASSASETNKLILKSSLIQTKIIVRQSVVFQINTNSSSLHKSCMCSYLVIIVVRKLWKKIRAMLEYILHDIIIITLSVPVMPVGTKVIIGKLLIFSIVRFEMHQVVFVHELSLFGTWDMFFITILS